MAVDIQVSRVNFTQSFIVTILSMWGGALAIKDLHIHSNLLPHFMAVEALEFLYSQDMLTNFKIQLLILES